jgi:hypothetical protein
MKEEQPKQQEQPQLSITKRVTTSLSLRYHTMSMREKMTYAAVGGGLSATVLELFGAAGPGLGLAALIAFASGFWSEELQQGLVKKLPRPRENRTVRQSKLAWWLGVETTSQEQPEQLEIPEQLQEEGEDAAHPAVDTAIIQREVVFHSSGDDEGQGSRDAGSLSDILSLPTLPGETTQNSTDETTRESIDALFQMAAAQEQETGIARLMPNDIIRNTEPDSYKICIGRSLTKKGNPPVWINFYGQHIKLIGASQYGKSSMAACILYLITRTHRPSNVLIALLDMENKTSKLFVDCQHIAEVNLNGKWVRLHARTKEQVLEQLGYILTIMEERYKLSEEEVEEEPILLVYLEEFLALKDYFKRLVDSTSGEAKEEAKKDYSQLVFRVSEIARRGLKAKVQLLMCAQVDYRDDDFQEALVNVTGGMSFCVRVSAAQAAGFVRTELLKKNVEDDKTGQAVCETPDCKDLILAPEYNLKRKLLALAKAQSARNPQLPRQQTRMIVPANTHQLPTTEQMFSGSREQTEELETPTVTDENQRKLTTLHRRALEHYQPGLGYRQLGELIGVGKDKAGEIIKDLKKWGFIEAE